jgi:hypothetical protein
VKCQGDGSLSHLKFSIGLSEYLPDKPKTLDEIFKITQGRPGRKEERNNKRVD